MYIGRNKMKLNDQLKQIGKVQNIVLIGLFLSLYLVLYSMNIKLTNLLEIRFGYFVIAVAAMYGGPVFAGIVGGLGDILSVILFAGAGMYFPGFTLNYVVLGIFFGLAFYGHKVTWPRAIFAAIGEFFVSIVMTTTWLHLMYGNPWIATFFTRLPKSCVTLILSTVLFYFVLNAVGAALKKARIELV